MIAKLQIPNNLPMQLATSSPIDMEPIVMRAQNA